MEQRKDTGLESRSQVSILLPPTLSGTLHRSVSSLLGASMEQERTTGPNSNCGLSHWSVHLRQAEGSVLAEGLPYEKEYKVK